MSALHLCTYGLCQRPGCPNNTELSPDATDQDLTDYLLTDGGAVPCSRYGRTSAECAPWAVAIVRIFEQANGEPVTYAQLHWAMGLVVNDHEDVAEIVAEHGTAEQRQLLEDLDQ